MSYIDRETIRWAYRLFLDREPENESVLGSQFADIPQLRNSFLASAEYRIKNNAGDFNWDTWVIKQTVHGFRIWVSLAEFGVSRPILHDSYDCREVQYLKSIIKTGDTVFDIGANIGFYSLLLSKLVGPTGRVLGFEPLSYLYENAQKSVIENNYQAFCSIKNLALSNHRGNLMIRHAPITTNFGGGHIAPDGNTPKDHVDEIVNVAPLDDFTTDSRVKFIKIDVEGAEPMVIEGGKSLISRDRPIILSELHNGQLKTVSNTTATAYIKRLRQLGYSCFDVTDTSFKNPIESYNEAAPINVLFVASQEVLF